MLAGLLFFLIGIRSFSWAQINLPAGNPLLQGATSYTFSMLIITKTKPTSCYVTSGGVSQCRRRRGIDEKPQLLQFDDFIISPSTVSKTEITAAPDAIDSRVDSNSLWSSFNEEMEYRTSQNLFRQLVANGRHNLITVGNCGQSVVDFSQFMSCLGLSLQETTTLTATFTETKTISTGFTTFTVAGCTPAGFPYRTCTQGTSDSLLGGLAGTDSNVLNTLLSSPEADIVNPILPPVTNVVSALPLPGQGILLSSGTTDLLGGLLPGVSNLPVGPLSDQGNTTSDLPVLGGLLSGGTATGQLPVVGGVLQGGTTGVLPLVGGLVSGDSTRGLRVVGGLLHGGTAGVLPVVGGLVTGGSTGRLSVVGGLLSSGTTAGLPILGGLLAGRPIGGLPIQGGEGVLDDGSQRMPLAYRSLDV